MLWLFGVIFNFCAQSPNDHINAFIGALWVYGFRFYGDCFTGKNITLLANKQCQNLVFRASKTKLFIVEVDFSAIFINAESRACFCFIFWILAFVAAQERVDSTLAALWGHRALADSHQHHSQMRALYHRHRCELKR